MHPVASLQIYAIILLTTVWEFLIISAVYGFQVCQRVHRTVKHLSYPHGVQIGSVQAFSRGVYSEIIPGAFSAQFFSFYEITDKGTSWLGPLLVGVVNQATGNFRLAFFCITFFFWIGGPLLYWVNLDKARQDAIKVDTMKVGSSGVLSSSISSNLSARGTRSSSSQLGAPLKKSPSTAPRFVSTKIHPHPSAE